MDLDCQPAYDTQKNGFLLCRGNQAAGFIKKEVGSGHETGLVSG
jgi:hypothetical protein